MPHANVWSGPNLDHSPGEGRWNDSDLIHPSPVRYPSSLSKPTMPGIREPGPHEALDIGAPSLRLSHLTWEGYPGTLLSERVENKQTPISPLWQAGSSRSLPSQPQLLPGEARLGRLKLALQDPGIPALAHGRGPCSQHPQHLYPSLSGRTRLNLSPPFKCSGKPLNLLPLEKPRQTILKPGKGVLSGHHRYLLSFLLFSSFQTSPLTVTPCSCLSFPSSPATLRHHKTPYSYQIPLGPKSWPKPAQAAVVF